MMSVTFKKRNRFDPEQKTPYKLSRSKIELFCDCPRCFYFDCRLGISRPPMLPFTLNNAVDQLLKNEFDTFREKKEPHPLMKIHSLDAIPYTHPKLNEWRENFKGIEFHYTPANFLITGAIDDIWITPKEELIIVDYKATSKEALITKPSDLHPAYKRQMEIYQWLFKNNGFNVHESGMFVYCNGLKKKPYFKRHLEFDVNLIPYSGNHNWIEEALTQIYETLYSLKAPLPSDKCEYCKYADNINKYFNN
jgi:hypothetical protein